MKNLFYLFFVFFANCSCLSVPKLKPLDSLPANLPTTNERFAYPEAVMIISDTKDGAPGLIVPMLTDYSLTCINGCLKFVCAEDSANLLCLRECLSYYPCQLTVIERGDWINSSLRLVDMNKNKFP